jgi:hypothetical protein
MRLAGFISIALFILGAGTPIRAAVGPTPETTAPSLGQAPASREFQRR